MMNFDYNIIENKLNKFIKKYYFNELIKGLIIMSLTLIIITSILLLIEFNFYLSVSRKEIFVYSYLIFFFFLFSFFCLIPLLGILNIYKGISKLRSNIIIVKHFPEIKDQLLNLFELKEANNLNEYSNDLLIASIDQKISKLEKFKFTEAIIIKKNLKLSLLLILLFCFSLLCIILYPEKIYQSSQRLINFKQQFFKPSPYSFDLLNDKLEIGNGDDFKICVHVKSEFSIDLLKVKIGNNTFLMNEDSLNYYSFKLNKVNNSLNFQFLVNKYYSRMYSIEVFQKPILSNFTISVISPSYTGIKEQNYENITEIIVPEGSQCNYYFKSFQTDSFIIKNNNDIIRIKGADYYGQKINSDQDIFISLKNKTFYIDNYLSISMKVIKDEFPTIGFSEITDSTKLTRIYYKGNIGDDYGFTNFKFVISVNDSVYEEFPVNILNFLLQQDFYYAFDFDKYKFLNTNILYYFQVSDNDAVNGNKVARSEIFTFKFPDYKDLLDFQDNKLDQIEDYVKKSKDITNEIKEEFELLKEKMINSELTDWDKNEILKNINSKKSSLENMIKQIENNNFKMDNYFDSFSEENSDLVKKQEQIQALLDEVFSDELKSLLDQFNEMVKELNGQKINELSEKLDVSLDDLNKQLDKNIELLKRMKIEQQLELLRQELENNLNKMNLSIQKSNSIDKLKELSSEQKEMKESLNSMKEEYDKIQKLNEELDKKLDLMDLSNDFNSIDQEFDNTINNIEQNNKKRSKESLEKNKSKMENLAFMLNQMTDNAFAKQKMENIEDLIQILDNVLTFSFDQENIVVSKSNADFGSIDQLKQKQLVNNFKVIDDSLYSLSQREPSLNTVINKEIVAIKNNFNSIDRILSENNNSMPRLYQQNILTSANNLALFMSEIIKQLQQQMASSMPGNQNCQKPGNNPNPNSMGNSLKSMQQSLQNQLEKMMQMMKEGKSGGSISSETGKALSQQEKMQDMLRQMMNQGNVGSGAYETLKEAEQLLNKVKDDLLRNNVSNQTLSREKQILTRLLEAENAQNERDLEEKRKSTTANKQHISESAKYFDNRDSNDNFEELMINRKLVFNRYYQNKYLKYLNSLDSINGGKY